MDCGQVDKYSSGVPFTGKIAEIKPTEQQVQQLVDAFVPLVEAVAGALSPIIADCVDAIERIEKVVNRDEG